jgi:ornithine cyclodeaminase/alanine dehydrogenase-like protein (mu-crystallin family)
MLPDHLPRSRVPDPADAPPLRWGVIGTGWIAERFVDALQSMTRQQVVAVGSRTDEGAATFARRFGILRAHGSYESLVGDLAYEAAETARRIVAGEKSTAYRPMADTVSTMEIIDEVRRQIGIVFPGEQRGKEPTV